MTALVLLSGWGLDARIWQPLAEHWPAGLEVATPDWPGYGTRRDETMPEAPAALAEAMAGSLPTETVWVGWSLGALLAGALLERLAPPRALVMLGMGTRFTRDQAPGVTPAELEAFREAFDRDPLVTWRHFLRWQLQGEPQPRLAHRRLQALIGAEPPASTASLRVGLDQLARLDLGAALAEAPCPVIGLRGATDPLIPAGAMPTAAPPITGAGHCPQLSRPDALAERLTALGEAPGETDRKGPR